jgi:uncharacterized protein YebE (UPF0316 family)
MNGFDYYSWVILPVLIALSRMCDVTIGTLRHILMHKGLKRAVPLLGFIEVLIWLIVIRQVMKNLDNWMCYIGWAGGFSCGTMLGMYLEEKMALGLQVIRIITNQDCTSLVLALRDANHGITMVDAQGAMGPVKMIFTVVKRKQVREIEQLISIHTPSAFYSLEEIKNVSQGVFSATGSKYSLLKDLFPIRKGK